MLSNIVVVKYCGHFVVKYCCGELSEANFVVRYHWGQAKGLQEIFVSFGTIFVTFATIFVMFGNIFVTFGTIFVTFKLYY